MACASVRTACILVRALAVLTCLAHLCVRSGIGTTTPTTALGCVWMTPRPPPPTAPHPAPCRSGGPSAAPYCPSEYPPQVAPCTFDSSAPVHCSRQKPCVCYVRCARARGTGKRGMLTLLPPSHIAYTHPVLSPTLCASCCMDNVLKCAPHCLIVAGVPGGVGAALGLFSVHLPPEIAAGGAGTPQVRSKSPVTPAGTGLHTRLHSCLPAHTSWGPRGGGVGALCVRCVSMKFGLAP